jgi:molybdate transport system substrate-binding protein
MCRLSLGIATLLCTLGAWAVPPPRASITVFAAASLTEALQACADRFTADTGIPVRLSFAASSVLARQIEAGAQADLFISADEDWMEYLSTRHRLQNETRRDLVGNRLVLIAAADDKVKLTIGSNFPLAASLGKDRLAVADPDVVPAGRYAQAALRSLKVWESVSLHLARAENVRGALQYVARGEARFGIVYETDAKLDARVRIVDVFPSSSHPPIQYPAALTSTAMPDTKEFLRYLSSAPAATSWKSFGFLTK